ncbi:MAG TPA: 30S ribosome-binding factor RbfA [Candidatus Limnocylindrales bacterium]
MSQRTDRIDELLRQEIGHALERELADPDLGFVTVTQVETSPDLRHARVWVSVIGSPAEREASLAALRRALPYVRHALGGSLRLKRIPEFHVRLDESMERGTRVLRILQELEEGRPPEEVASEEIDEELPTPVRRLPKAGDVEEPVADPAASAVPPEVVQGSGAAARRPPQPGSREARHGRRTGPPRPGRRPR